MEEGVEVTREKPPPAPQIHAGKNLEFGYHPLRYSPVPRGRDFIPLQANFMMPASRFLTAPPRSAQGLRKIFLFEGSFARSPLLKPWTSMTL